MSALEQLQIPDKLFYRINEVASLTTVKPYVLRYWETEFPMLSPEKDENDQRRYRKSDIELVLEIKRLLYTEKFTIAGARKQLRQGKGERAAESASAPTAVAESDVAAATMLQGPTVVVRADVSRIREALNLLRNDVEELNRYMALR